MSKWVSAFGSLREWDSAVALELLAWGVLENYKEGKEMIKEEGQVEELMTA